MRSGVRLIQGTPITFYFEEDVRAVIQIFMKNLGLMWEVDLGRNFCIITRKFLMKIRKSLGISLEEENSPDFTLSIVP